MWYSLKVLTHIFDRTLTLQAATLFSLFFCFCPLSFGCVALFQYSPSCVTPVHVRNPLITSNKSFVSTLLLAQTKADPTSDALRATANRRNRRRDERNKRSTKTHRKRRAESAEDVRVYAKISRIQKRQRYIKVFALF